VSCGVTSQLHRYIAIAIVGLFVVSNLPRIILGFQEATFHANFAQIKFPILQVMSTSTIIECISIGAHFIPTLNFFLWDCVARFLMIVNSSVNFLVYCGGSSSFQVSFLRRRRQNPNYLLSKRSCWAPKGTQRVLSRASVLTSYAS